MDGLTCLDSGQNRPYMRLVRVELSVRVLTDFLE